jgi:hypoxanthine phosphoribosyltransferase
MKNITVLFDETAIQKKTSEIAVHLNDDFKGKNNVVILSVLKGSFIFTADLVRKLDFNFDLVFIEVSSYRNSTHSGEIILKKKPDYNFTNKHVILIEDIVDTGNTINFLCDLLNEAKVKSISLSSIIAKKNKYNINIPFNYPGFFIEDQFVVGYGLDYGGLYRNLPYIGILQAYNI